MIRNMKLAEGRINLLGKAVLGLILLLLFAGMLAFIPMQDVSEQAVSAAVNYLINNYNATVGLIPEVPGGNVYYLYSDSFLASYALWRYDPNNSTLANIAANISSTISKHIQTVSNPLNQYMILNSSIAVFNASEDYTISHYGDAIINITLNNGTKTLSPSDYADIAFLKALYYHGIGQVQNASNAYQTGKNMFNGKGLNDTAFQNGTQKGQYQTFKLALHIYASKILGQPCPEDVETILLRMQASSGGFYTGYDENFSTDGTNTNVETTSLAILALLQPPANQPQIGAYYYAWWGMDINNHWLLDDIKGTPFLGDVNSRSHYNSSDPTIADQQILLAMQHGIDFFAVSWAGKGQWLNWDFSVIDYNLRNGLLNASHLGAFKFCLFYETVLVLDTSINLSKNFTQIFIEDMEYSLQQYFNNPSYLRIKGSPVLFIYNVPHLYAKMAVEDVRQLFDYVRQQLAADGVDLYVIGDMGNGPSSPDPNSPWLYSLNATTSYHFSDGYTSWDKPLQNAEIHYPQWLSNMSSIGIGFVPDACPGSNTTNNTGVKKEDWKVFPRTATAFKQMLQIALNNTSSTPALVMVTSWNEWMEGTQIEPSMEEGELFLHVIYNIIPEFPSFLILPLFMLSTLSAVLVYRRKRALD